MLRFQQEAQKNNLKRGKKPPGRKKRSQTERIELEDGKKWQRLGYLWTWKATKLCKKYVKWRDDRENN